MDFLDNLRNFIWNYQKYFDILMNYVLYNVQSIIKLNLCLLIIYIFTIYFNNLTFNLLKSLIFYYLIYLIVVVLKSIVIII